MKLLIPCTHCTLESGDVLVDDIVTVEFRDDGCYETICSMGHRSTTILQEQKFELLFDIGAFAINDGYYREAVASFTSSLERFYEFFIKAAYFEKDIDSAIVADSWKRVAKQSERQLGGFIVLYTNDFGKNPPILNNADSRFRNDVIHNGKIPSRQEALKYGQTVLDLIQPMLLEVKEKYPKGVSQTVTEHIKKSIQGVEGRRSTITIPTIVSINREPRDESIEQAIEKLQQRRSYGDAQDAFIG